MVIATSPVSSPEAFELAPRLVDPSGQATYTSNQISRLLTDELLPAVFKPGQYLGNEWGARRKSFAGNAVRLALAFPDMYELGILA
jgi:hypothetical protein